MKCSFLYPHNHRLTPTIHTGITPESTQSTGRKAEKQTQQNGSKPTYQDRRLALSNKINASGGNGKNEKQDRWFTSTPLVAMARMRNKIDASKGKRWQWQWGETFNPIQPTDQAHSTQKQRETKEERAIGSGGDRRKLEEEKLMRGREIDERKKKRVVRLREREGAESQVQRGERKN